ncbi:Uncharacterised protein [Vibrio cholerae]|nr:Uncharacterised protein [Vibrio cholerae]
MMADLPSFFSLASSSATSSQLFGGLGTRSLL